MINKPVREAVRMIDAIESENDYFLDKCPEHYDIIDRKARKLFSNGLSSSALK